MTKPPPMAAVTIVARPSRLDKAALEPPNRKAEAELDCRPGRLVVVVAVAPAEPVGVGASASLAVAPPTTVIAVTVRRSPLGSVDVLRNVDVTLNGRPDTVERDGGCDVAGDGDAVDAAEAEVEAVVAVGEVLAEGEEEGEVEADGAAALDVPPVVELMTDVTKVELPVLGGGDAGGADEGDDGVGDGAAEVGAESDGDGDGDGAGSGDDDGDGAFDDGEVGAGAGLEDGAGGGFDGDGDGAGLLPAGAVAVCVAVTVVWGGVGGVGVAVGGDGSGDPLGEESLGPPALALPGVDDPGGAAAEVVAVGALAAVLLLSACRFARITISVAALASSRCTTSMAVRSFSKMPSRYLFGR